MLLLGKKALRYSKFLPHFSKAHKIFLMENGNEISFIINKNLKILKQMPYYEKLRRLGFKEELCLGNKAFIKTYIDK